MLLFLRSRQDSAGSCCRPSTSMEDILEGRKRWREGRGGGRGGREGVHKEGSERGKGRGGEKEGMNRK